MPHELSKAYDPAEIEKRWAEYWVSENLFHTETPKDGANTFTLLLPPPNVTGRLHMGHMLNHTEMDILVRWQRMLGKDSMWLPGTDHAGIATQMMVERQLATRGQEAPGPWPRSFHRARVGVEGTVRRIHSGADEAARRFGGLVARILHHG